jgi:pimeloyl-[acyl-carrier protein] methyl ester esterase
MTKPNIHIETLGSGPHLAFIHGWGMNSSVWHPFVKKLSKLYTLHLVDLPGMGYSQMITPYDLQSVSDQISERLPNNTNIVGWSLGGQVAMRIAIDQPDVVNKLILVGTTPCFVNVTGFSLQPHWRLGVQKAVFEKFADNVTLDYQKTMLSFLTLQCLGGEDANSTLRILRQQFKEQPSPTLNTLSQALKILLETDLRPEIEQIYQPTLIIHGDKDTLAPLPAANWLSQHLPNALLRVINGAAHAPFLSHQTDFYEALLTFLQSDVTY